MVRERAALEEAYRAHLRQMAAVRQAAERQRATLHAGDAEERREP